MLSAVINAELTGQSGRLDIEVQVGAEQVGEVAGPAQVTVRHPGGPAVNIDAFEGSVADGAAVSAAGAAPARGVSWFAARDACEAAGKRLCTEAEWLAACMGGWPKDEDGNGVFSDDDQDGRVYPYGDFHRPGACADNRGPEPGDLRTGDHPNCGTPEGVYDLAGGVKEWVGLRPSRAAVKGGSYLSGDSARCGYHRDDYAPGGEDPTTGFRCCAGAVPDGLDDGGDYPGGQVGDKIMDFEVQLLDGGRFSADQLRGKPALLVFWASWCGPCREEMPILSALYGERAAEGLTVLAVSVDSDADKARAWLRANPMLFPVAIDDLSSGAAALMGRFDTRGVPTTFWIDPDGTIRLRTTGVPPGGEKRLRALADELLGGSAAAE